jgi:hypothetical protein
MATVSLVGSRCAAPGTPTTGAVVTTTTAPTTVSPTV